MALKRYELKMKKDPAVRTETQMLERAVFNVELLTPPFIPSCCRSGDPQRPVYDEAFDLFSLPSLCVRWAERTGACMAAIAGTRASANLAGNGA